MPDIIYRITVQNEATAGITAATGELERMGQTAQLHTQSIAGVGTAMERTGAQGTNFGGVLHELEGHFGQLITLATGVGLAFSAEQLFKGTLEKTQEISGEVYKLRQQLGGTAEDASRLRTIFEETGISIDAGTRALDRLSKGLAGAAQDADGLVIPAGAVVKTLNSLGIETEDSTGKLKSMAEILPLLGDRVSHMADGAEKTALMMTLMGRSGADMLPVFNLNGEALKKLAEESDKFGLTLSGKQLDDMHRFTLQQREMNAEWSGMQLQIGMQVIPVLKVLLGLVQDGEASFKDIAAAVEDFAGTIHDLGTEIDKTFPGLSALLSLIPGGGSKPSAGSAPSSGGGGGIDWGNVLKDAVAGAAVGGIAGTILPGPGTVVGALIGGAAGAAAGIHGHATGGPAQGLFRVGEAGEEVVYAPGGAHVFSNDQSRAMGLIGGGLPGYRTGTGNAIADEISDWADAHEGLGGLTARQLAEVLITGAHYETGIIDANDWPYAGGPFSFDDTSPGYPHGGGNGGTWSAATRLGYDVHSASSSLNYFLAHDQLSSAAGAIKAALDAGSAMASASFEYERLVERPDMNTVASRGGGAWSGSAAVAARMVAAAYAAGAAAPPAAQVTAPGVGASDASQGVIGVGGGGAAAGSSPGGNPDNPDISGGAPPVGSSPSVIDPATQGQPIIGGVVSGGTAAVTVPATRGSPGQTITTAPAPSIAAGTPVGGAGTAAPGGVVAAVPDSITGGIGQPSAAGDYGVGQAAASVPMAPNGQRPAVAGFDWPAEQAKLGRMAQPTSSGAQLYTLARLIATLVEQGDAEAAVRMLSTVPAAGFQTLVAEVRAIIQQDQKEAGKAVDELDPRLANIAERAAPAAAANVPPPAFPQGLFQQQIDNQLHPQGVQAQVFRAGQAIAEAIEASDIPGAIKLLGMVPKDNFDAVVAQAQGLLTNYATQNRLTASQLTELQARLNAAESGAAGTVATSTTPGYIDTSQPVPFQQGIFDQQIQNVLHPKSIAAQVFTAAQAIAVAVEMGNRAGAIHLLGMVPPDDFDQVVSQVRAFLQAYATQNRLTADQLAGLSASLNAAEAGAAPTVATSTLPAYVAGDQQGLIGGRKWSVDPATGKVVLGAAQYGAGDAPQDYHTDPTTGRLIASPRAAPAAAAAAPATATHVTVNVHATPTSSTDPALSALIRALDEYLKRMGQPGLVPA